MIQLTIFKIFQCTKFRAKIWFFFLIPGIFLSNFDTGYTNKYYHSLYDNSTLEERQIEHLSKLSETLARFAYKTLNVEIPSNFEADRDLIKSLIQCYTVTAKCDYFQAMTSPDFVSALPDNPLPQYVGVTRSYTYHTLFTHRYNLNWTIALGAITDYF